jgi:hypothetical protein
MSEKPHSLQYIFNQHVSDFPVLREKKGSGSESG